MPLSVWLLEAPALLDSGEEAVLNKLLPGRRERVAAGNRTTRLAAYGAGGGSPPEVHRT